MKHQIHTPIIKPAQVGDSSAAPAVQAGSVMGEELRPYLEPTRIINSDHSLVAEFAAVRLYLAVRDGFR